MSNRVNRRKRNVQKYGEYIKRRKVKKEKKENNIIYTTKDKDDIFKHSFEKVDIFLRVKGRLPNKAGDSLTQEILDDYCERYEKGELTVGIVPLEYMYNLIKWGDIKAII